MDYEKQAKDFLKRNNTTLEIEYKKFGPMSWDNDGQHRNIFDITLSNKNGSYTFEFGNSIVDSCEMENEIDIVDKIEVFAGLRYTESKINVSVKFDVLKENDFNLTYEEVERLANKMLKSYNIQRDNRVKKYLSVSTKDNGAYVQCIQRAIKREVEKISNSKDYSKTKQKDGIVKPNGYDILAGLSVYYFESPDDVVENFGCMKPSQAMAIYEQDQELQKLFNEEQLDELSEIC